MSYINYEMDEATFLEYAHAKRMWIKWPKRCRTTGKWIWLRKAICAVRMITGPGDTIFEFRYYDEKEFLMLKLRLGF